MNNEHKIIHQVKYSEVDNNYHMRLDHMMTQFEDVTGLHSVEMKIDGQNLLKSSNAFWVLTKMKIKVYEIPKFNDQVTIRTWPTFAKGVKFGRSYEIKKDDKIMVICNSEWCTLDYDTQRPRRVDSICYPHSMNHLEQNKDIGEFFRIKETLEEDDLNYIHKVKLTDIDTNNHVNNVSYIRMILNCFSLEEYEKLKIKEIQISYVSQTFDKDSIKMFKKKTDYGFYIEGRSNEVTAFSSIIVI